MLATTGSVKVALESACIMLLRFRVRLLGLRVAWRDISIHTCCALSSSLSAHAAKSPARKRRRQARRGRRRPRSCKSHCMEHSAERAETCACMQHVHACARAACTRTKLQKHARGIKHHPCCDALAPLPCACMVAAWSIAQFARTRWLACMQRADALASMHAARSARGWVCVGMHAEACTSPALPPLQCALRPALLRSHVLARSCSKGKGQISVL